MTKLNPDNDGSDRRGFLECGAGAGTGLLVGFSGGIDNSQSIHGEHPAKTDLRFAQISDGHIGLNRDVALHPKITTRLTVLE